MQEDARAGGKIMKMREDDIPEVREESFRYSGPKPQTKESAIVSLADMVESASRCLEKPTPAKIEQLVNDIIDQRIAIVNSTNAISLCATCALLRSVSDSRL